MASDLNINNSLYVEFKDAKPSWSLIGCALSYNTIGIFGMFFNFCVIFVTFRSKSLKGTANFLLTLCSFFELLHQQGHFLFMFTALSGKNFIEYEKAAMFMAFSIFGLGGIGISMFFTGLDRLICLLLPTMHSALNLQIYLGTITSVCALFGLALLYTVYLTAQQLNGMQVSGCIVDLLQGPSGAFYAQSNLYTNIITCIFYVIIVMSIQIQIVKNNSNAAATSRRLLRALFAIIAVNMGGYLVNTVYILLLRPSISSPITAWFWQVITGISLNVSAASNGPILYLTSTEYQQAFHSMFPSFFKYIQKIKNPAQTRTVQLKTITVNARKHNHN